jgi:hypothetical protein
MVSAIGDKIIINAEIRAMWLIEAKNVKAQ